MIAIENLSFSFPEKDLYNNISFTLEDHQHCAFIGTSGTGKSTLVDLIMNPDKYLYDGKLTITPGFRIGYVSQLPESENIQEMTVFDYLAEEFILLQARMDALCLEMETAADPGDLLEQYQECLDYSDAIGGSEYESSITRQLNLAGLNNHKSLTIAQLSSGEFKLIQVIRAMLTQPDLMIMDEPDVFLDFERLIALKYLINSYKRMMLVITHNRFLLHHCFNKIIHLEGSELQEFDGKYAAYNLALLQRKIELQEQAHKESEEIERNKLIVDKMRTDATNVISAQKGRAVSARATHLKRLEDRRIKEPFVEIRQPLIQLTTTCPIADAPVMKVVDYQVSFEDTLLEHVSFEINATDKVALIGPNGTGKTTLLRDIYHHTSDAIELHSEASLAFLSQQQGEMLNESNTIWEEFSDTDVIASEDLKRHLKHYGFDEENLTKIISVLSGGEKNLLQLAKIALGNANLLLLDEPTSHLDTYAQIALEEAVKNYNGAILMVSHDFYTIANCVDYVLLIENQSIRKISSRKFRKMIYANHFDKDYLELAAKKKELEIKIARALQDKDFVLAQTLSKQLEEI